MKTVTKRFGAVILAVAIALTFMPALPVHASVIPGAPYMFDFTGDQLPGGKGDGILFSTASEKEVFEIQKNLLKTLVGEESIDNLGTNSNPKYDIDKNGVWDFDIVDCYGKPAFRVNNSSKIFDKPSITITTNYFMEHGYEQYGEYVDFAFYKKSIDDASLTIGNVWYTGDPVKPSLKIVLAGETLKEGRDYSVTWYSNEDAGINTGYVVINGTRRFDGGLQSHFTIKRRGLTSAKISYKAIPDYTWDGNAKKPAIKASLDGLPLQKGQDYTVQYKYNTNVGQAKVILTGKGNYTGTKTLYFKINPKKTSIQKLTGDKGSFTVKWYKRTEKMSKSQITGYQIQYSKKSDFSTKTSVWVPLKNKSGNYNVSKKINNLKKGKYYVRIRTYKKISSNSVTKKYYSGWYTYKNPVTVK